MSWLGGGDHKPSAKEQEKMAKKNIRGGQRDLERELRKLEREEAKAVAEAKQMAKRGDTYGAKTMAKQVVQIRKAKQRMMQSKAQLGSVGMQITTMGATAKMVGAMGTASHAMHVANQQMNPQQLSAIMRQFEQANMQMDMTDEMMADLFEDEELDTEADAAVSEIFESIGLEATMGMADAPSKVPQQAPAGAVSDAEAERMMNELLAGM